MLLALTDNALALSAIGLIAGGAIAFLLLLRAARFPLEGISGRAIVAGVLAGLLLGPSVLGRVLPQQFEWIFVGGIKQREAVDYARWFNAHAPAAITNMTAEALQAMREQGAREIATKQSELDQTRWEHQRPLRLFAMIVVALVLLAPARRSTLGSAGDKRQGWITPVSVGVWSFALPAAFAFMCGMRWWDVSVAEAGMLAGAVGIGPWMLGAIDRDVANGAEFGGTRMMMTAGRIASTLAIAIAMWAAFESRGSGGLISVAPLLALPLTWVIGWLTQRAPSTARSDQTLAIESLLAILAALVAMKIDIHASFTLATLGPLIVLGLLADDGRWLGAFLGAMLLGGRPALRTMRLVMPAMAAGPTQLAVAALALHSGLLPERFALPLVVGLLLIEFTAPARRHLAAGLINAEEELENELSDDE